MEFLRGGKAGVYSSSTMSLALLVCSLELEDFKILECTAVTQEFILFVCSCFFKYGIFSRSSRYHRSLLSYI